jgi:hypothetical protein
MKENTGTKRLQGSPTNCGSAGAGRSVRLKLIGTRRKVLWARGIRGRSSHSRVSALSQTKVPIANSEFTASRPTQFLLGDFAVIARTLSNADVLTLDRVVCCYLDADALLQAAAARTNQLLAFTYPRDRWHVRAVIAVENFLRRLRGKAFRAFVHRPQ